MTQDTKELIFFPFSELRKKGKTEIFPLSDMEFQISFKGSSNPESIFNINVKCSETTFGTIKIIVINPNDPKKNIKYQTRGEMVKDTARPCRLKQTYKEIQKFVKEDKLTIQFSFIPREKKALPVAMYINNPQSQNINRKINTISQSRQTTGYVGLRNGGNTCYMNSILQALFNIPSFRRLIFNADQDDEIELKINILKNLQILFYNLQTSFTACSTSPLRVSFGWSSSDAFQEDVHEFFNLFLNKIIEKLKTKGEKNDLESLFKFKVKKSIVNKEVGFSKDLKVDIQSILSLYIKKSKNNIQDMVNNMTSELTYNVPNHGEMDCIVEETFVTLPRILLVHLNRSVFDIESSRNYRLNTPISYQKTIDVKLNDKTVSFELHGILNHLSRSASSGHYIAVLRPTNDDDWFSFNDSYVSRVSKGSEMNYEEDVYMLVYARKDVEEIEFKKVTDEEIPEKVKKIVNEASFDFIHVQFITTSNIEASTKSPYQFIDSKECISIPVGSNDTTESMYSTIRESLELNADDQITLWKCRHNGTPISLIPCGREKAFPYVKDRNPVFIQNGVGKSNEKLAFIKFFDAEKSEVRVLDSICSPNAAKPSDLFKQIESSLQLKCDGFIVFHEPPENSNKPIQIDPNLTIEKIEKFENGSSLIFQVNKPPKINESEVISFYNGQDNLYPTFLSMVRSSVKSNLSFGEVKSIQYPSDFKMSDLKSFIASIINHSKTSIVLFFETSHDYFECSLNFNEDSRQPLSPNNERIPTIYVKLFETTQNDDQIKQKMKAFVVYSSQDSFNVSKVSFAVESNETTISEIVKKYEVRPNKPSKVSLMNSGRLQKRLQMDSTIEDVFKENGSNFVIRIDEIQNNEDINTKFLTVNLFIEKRKEKKDEGEKSMAFYLPIIDGEKFAKTKERIGKIAELKENVISSLIFNLYSTYRNENDKNVVTPKCPKLKNDLILSEVEVPDLCIDISRPFSSSANSHVLKIYN